MKERDFYLDLYRKHGDTVQSLGYGSKRSQIDRFDVLLKIGPLYGASILDVGCGFGDLYGHLREVMFDVPVSYTGCDMIDEFIQVAEHNNPGGEFHNVDFLEWDLGERQFDYVLGCGVFALDKKWYDENVLKMVKKMFSLCLKGVAINFLNVFRGGTKPKDMCFKNPFEVADDLHYYISHKLVLRTDYRDNDFTVFLYK